jgi:hypothetical protein
MENIEKVGVYVLEKIISMIVLIAMFGQEVPERDLAVSTPETPARSMSSTYINRFGEFRILMTAETVWTKQFGYPSTKVSFSVRRNLEVLKPSSPVGGCVIGGDRITPADVILLPLGKQGSEVGWVIGLDGISGNTFSYLMTLVVPSFNAAEWEYRSVSFLAKEGITLVSEKDGLEVWSQYQEWGGGGTAVSFFVPQLRRIRVSDEGEAHLFLDRLPPDYKRWPKLKYLSFLGLYLGGAANLNPELMEASFDLFDPDVAEVYRCHGLPGDEAGLRKEIEEVRRTRRLMARFRHFDLEWEENFQGETAVRGLEDLHRGK